EVAHERAMLCQAGHFVSHAQFERRKFLCPCGEEIQKIPLRHQNGEFRTAGEMAKVGDGDGCAADDDVDICDFLMRSGAVCFAVVAHALVALLKLLRPEFARKRGVEPLPCEIKVVTGPRPEQAVQRSSFRSGSAKSR